MTAISKHPDVGANSLTRLRCPAVESTVDPIHVWERAFYAYLSPEYSSTVEVVIEVIRLSVQQRSIVALYECESSGSHLAVTTTPLLEESSHIPHSISSLRGA